MHGLYERPADRGQVDGAAVVNGWCWWRWRGLPMPHFRSALVSPWNPIRAQGLRLHPISGEGDCDTWAAEALLAGLKPYGVFEVSRREFERWQAAAAAVGFDTWHTRDYWPHPFRLTVFAARTQTYAELFDLDALAADYAAALPIRLAEPEIEALTTHAGRSPAEYNSRDGFAALECQAASVLGLTLGYPPEVTAAFLARAADVPANMRYAEYGSLTRHPGWFPRP